MDNETARLARQLGTIFADLEVSLATAESCTGGWIAQVITAVPGCSGWFERGFVTYSNLSKEQMLGVRRQTLERHGAVSEQTAREMAAGALAHSNAHVSVAVTGIAGPDGGSADKPVGTVWIGWARRDAYVDATCFHFDGDREAVRRATVKAALEGLVQRLGEGLQP